MMYELGVPVPEMLRLCVKNIPGPKTTRHCMITAEKYHAVPVSICRLIPVIPGGEEGIESCP